MNAHRLRVSFLLTLILLITVAPSWSAHPRSAPPAPRATGRVVRVSNIQELYQAVDRLQSNTTVVLARGEYVLTKPLHLKGLQNVALRGATQRFEDVVIRGAGMNNKAVYHGIMAKEVDGLTVANLTLGWVGYHPITISANCRKLHVYHCRLVDAGEQFIKANSDKRGGGADDGIVEYCQIEYTKQGPPNGYTNGVDVHGGKNWIIRHNLFRNIRTPTGAEYRTVPAVLMWNGAKNTTCEMNSFVNCDRAIAFGLVRRNGFLDHEGGVIQNNFIFVGRNEVPNVDTGIFVASPDTHVVHNTILLNGGYPNAVELRWKETTGGEVHNNLSDARIVARNGATLKQTGNFVRAQATWFPGAAAGTPRLNRSLSQVKRVTGCDVDWDNQRRNAARTTPGCDEQGSRPSNS